MATYTYDGDGYWVRKVSRTVNVDRGNKTLMRQIKSRCGE